MARHSIRGVTTGEELDVRGTDSKRAKSHRLGDKFMATLVDDDPWGTSFLVNLYVCRFCNLIAPDHHGCPKQVIGIDISTGKMAAMKSNGSVIFLEGRRKHG